MLVTIGTNRVKQSNIFDPLMPETFYGFKFMVLSDYFYI